MYYGEIMGWMHPLNACMWNSLSYPLLATVDLTGLIPPTPFHIRCILGSLDPLLLPWNMAGSCPSFSYAMFRSWEGWLHLQSRFQECFPSSVTLLEASLGDPQLLRAVPDSHLVVTVYREEHRLVCSSVPSAYLKWQSHFLEWGLSLALRGD